MVLGIIGGFLGLLLSPIFVLLAISVLLVAALAQAPQLLVLFVAFLTAPIAAVLGIIGGILSRNRPRLGGIIMLISGLWPLVLGTVGFVSLAAAASDDMSSRSVGVTIIFALDFWAFIVVLGGIVSLRAKPLTKPALPPPPS